MTFVTDPHSCLLDELNVDGYTPLMVAVEKGNEPIFEMLLAAGAR